VCRPAHPDQGFAHVLGHKIAALLGNYDATDDALAAIQAAIWHDEYGVSVAFAGTGYHDAGVESQLYNSYIAETFNVSYFYQYTNGRGVQGFDANNNPMIGTIQGLVIGTPEPSSWAMMTLGLGLLGGLLRRRRATA
jgi:PEP-CTERM motif